jgi:hypothetical protein
MPLCRANVITRDSSAAVLEGFDLGVDVCVTVSQVHVQSRSGHLVKRARDAACPRPLLPLTQQTTDPPKHLSYRI